MGRIAPARAHHARARVTVALCRYILNANLRLYPILQIAVSLSLLTKQVTPV